MQLEPVGQSTKDEEEYGEAEQQQSSEDAAREPNFPSLVSDEISASLEASTTL